MTSAKEGPALIRLILVGTVLLLALSFFLQNQEQEVTLRYFFGLRSASILIYKPILAAFGVGLLVSGILLFPAWVRGRIELRRKTKALQEAEVDLERLRQAAGQGEPWTYSAVLADLGTIRSTALSLARNLERTALYGKVRLLYLRSEIGRASCRERVSSPV